MAHLERHGSGQNSWPGKLHATRWAAALVGVWLLAPLALEAQPGEGMPAAPSAIRGPHIHSHNDYNRHPPLHRALRNGARSIEVDLFEREGRILVAHISLELVRGRTLVDLYLEPLMRRVAEHGGSLHGDGKPLYLYFDNKEPWGKLAPALLPLLERYRSMLTVFYPGGRVDTGAVIVVTHARSQPGDTTLYATGVGPAALDLPLGQPPRVAMVSAHWRHLLSWNGRGKPSPEDVRKLRAYVNRAHAKGWAVRFWGGPDRPRAWKWLMHNGVDLIHTNHTGRLRRTFRHLDLQP